MSSAEISPFKEKYSNTDTTNPLSPELQMLHANLHANHAKRYDDVCKEQDQAYCFLIVFDILALRSLTLFDVLLFDVTVCCYTL